jgi:hypothetical protein
MKIIQAVNIVSEFSGEDKERAIPFNDLFKVIIKHIAPPI